MNLDIASPEDEAAQRLEALQHALEAADVGVWLWDIASDRVILSDQSKQLLGGWLEEALGYVGFLACIHHADRARVDAYLRARPGEETACDIVFRVATPAETWVRLRGRLCSRGGRLGG